MVSDKSIVVATGAECASKQDKFWEYHDLIFDLYHFDTSAYNYDLILEYAETLELEIDEFEDCMLNGEGFRGVQDSHVNAMELGVDQTPTLRVNDKWINSYDALDAAIDLEVRRRTESPQ